VRLIAVNAQHGFRIEHGAFWLSAFFNIPCEPFTR